MTGVTQSGRYLGRKKDERPQDDPRFGVSHPKAMALSLPPKIDLNPEMPSKVSDQLDMQSCVAHVGANIEAFLFPAIRETGVSRLQIYYGGRAIEDTVDEDTGLQTGNMFRVLQSTGAAPENLWPYDKLKIADEPTEGVYAMAAQYRIGPFSRLTTEAEYLACLAQRYPFALGMEVYESFDSVELARTGVMAMPDVAREQVIGGHAVTVVGFDLNFKQSNTFKNSGVDPARMSDVVLKARNSYGPLWGDSGNLYIPMPYALSTTTGADALTARL
jgi:C1A family cysteine protease